MRAYRGTILNPRGERQCAFYPDGLLVVNDAGQVAAIGAAESVARRFAPGAIEIIESKPLPLILPAFTDVHLHWVQNRIKGTAAEQGLLPWLNERVWPEESRFAKKAYAVDAAKQFWTDLARAGTMVGAVYSSIHPMAMDAFAPPFGHFVVGNVLMTQNCPPALTQSEEEAIALCGQFAAKHGRAYAVSPRFAPTCSMEVLKRAAQVADRHGCFIQTHLAENLDEVALVHKLFPDCPSYTSVYQRAGLLRPRTILGHCIYLDDDELALLKEANAVIAHCPTSNEALGSGRMPIEQIRKAGIRWALASDIAAGPSLSMLHVIKTFLRVHADAGMRISPLEALYRASLAGAEALGLSDRCGNLDVGKEANFLLLAPPMTGKQGDALEAVTALISSENSDFGRLTQGAFFRGKSVPL